MSVLAWSKYRSPAANTLNESKIDAKVSFVFKCVFIGYSVSLSGTSLVLPIEVYHGIKIKNAK